MSQFPQRPKATADMILAAATVVAAKINADAATIAQHYHHPMDGFALAKRLDRDAYWDTSREDMEELDEVEYLVTQAVRQAEAEWAKTLDQTLILPAGVKIKCKVRGELGVITGLTGGHHPACYLVTPVENPVEGQSWIVPYELAELAE